MHNVQLFENRHSKAPMCNEQTYNQHNSKPSPSPFDTGLLRSELVKYNMVYTEYVGFTTIQILIESFQPIRITHFD
jgi:hypothetical protein